MYNDSVRWMWGFWNVEMFSEVWMPLANIVIDMTGVKSGLTVENFKDKS